MELQSIAAKIEAKGAKLVAVSSDTADDAKGLADKLGLTFPLLADSDLRITRAFGVEHEGKKIPWSSAFLIGKDGKVKWREISSAVPTGKRATTDAILRAL